MKLKRLHISFCILTLEPVVAAPRIEGKVYGDIENFNLNPKNCLRNILSGSKLAVSAMHFLKSKKKKIVNVCSNF